MPKPTVTLSLDELSRLTFDALSKIGVNEDDARIVHDVLTYAQLRDNSQGLVKVIERTVAPDPAAGEITIENRSGATLRINGNRCLGMVVCSKATDEVCALALEHGIGFVGAYNNSTSTGAIGYYAEKIANQGLIGIVMAGSGKVMAMAGGIDPVFGTNPIAISIPTTDEPLVLDMATAGIALFGVIEAGRQGEMIADGLAYDEAGEPTIDPASALKGALRTFGGYKGAGLAMMIEAMTGPLVGAGVVGDEDAASNRGTAFIAIDPNVIVGEKAYNEAVGRMIMRIRKSRALPGGSEILLPGDRGRGKVSAKRSEGSIDLDKRLYDELRALIVS